MVHMKSCNQSWPRFLMLIILDSRIILSLYLVEEYLLRFRSLLYRRPSMLKTRKIDAVCIFTFGMVWWLIGCLVYSTNQSISQSINQSINQSIYQSINQSIYLSIYRSIYQSINQSIYLSIDLFIIFFLLFWFKVCLLYLKIHSRCWK